MNDFRKRMTPERKLSAREAVLLFGDDWRLLGNTAYNWSDTMTPDKFDYYLMNKMERGEWGRVRPEDLR